MNQRSATYGAHSKEVEGDALPAKAAVDFELASNVTYIFDKGSCGCIGQEEMSATC